ncbi:asparagine synthase-related protein [Streptomyces sp. NPDC059785]|uniref:asparagine synthase-related protein n=1 Tax=unclassified Streptomyces TaxID=2593676 RepID=UPI0036475799
MGAVAVCWFVVLPDHELDTEVIRRLRRGAGPALRVVPHASGRPWLAGAWEAGELVAVSAGHVRLAVAGTCSLTAGDLARRAGRIRGLADVEAVLAGAAGSFHVLASVGGHTHVRGPAFGQRAVYTATAGGGTLCADRARTLAWLTGARLDTAQVAVRLAGFTVPFPLAGGGMWRGVRQVPAGRAVRVNAAGRASLIRWWQPPEGGLPLAEAAPAVRLALRKAVGVRVRPGEVLGADLSGGMDSTSLCFLAAEAGARLVTATFHWKAPGNQDHVYAARAAGHLPLLDHLVYSGAGLPAHYAGLDDRREPGDGPFPVRDRARQHHLAGQMLARGAVCRLTGHGGDHALLPPDAYVHALLRRSPLTALRHAAGLRSRRRWPLAANVAMVLDGRSYPSWLNRLAAPRRLRPDPADPRRSLTTGWGRPCVLPPWASEYAVGLVGELLHAAARDAEPLAAERGRHAWIHQAQEAGRIAAHLMDETSAAGLPAHSPFCDDTVIDACLTVRPHDATSPWSYKPLLAAAMEGLVPAPLLHRTTKDHCSAECHEGLRLHRPTLAAWAADSRLAAAGIADVDLLRHALLSPGLLRGGVPQLEATLGAEAWLRDLETHPVPAWLDRPAPHPHDNALAQPPDTTGASR